MRGLVWRAAVFLLWMGLAAGRAGAQGLYAENGVYRIESFRALTEFSQMVSGSAGAFTGEAWLMCDIEADGLFVPIGSPEHMFLGLFNGQGHVISGLRTMGAGEFEGLFGYVGMGGRVMNLTLQDIFVSGERYAGGVAGYSAGVIENCRVERGHVAGTGKEEYGASTGGAVGLSNGTVKGCVNLGVTVTGRRYVGGIAGRQCAGTMEACLGAGSVRSVTRGQALAGGIAGSVQTGGKIIKCISAGQVCAPDAAWAGGIAGGLLSGEMKDCISLGRVTGREPGNVTGYSAQHAQIVNCRFAPWTPDGVGEGRQAGVSSIAGGRRLYLKPQWLIPLTE